MTVRPFNILLRKIAPGFTLLLISAFGSGMLWVAVSIVQLQTMMQADTEEDKVVFDVLDGMKKDLLTIKSATIINAANTSYLLKQEGLDPIEIPALSQTPKSEFLAVPTSP